jgi:hypothetical protein
MAAEFFGAHLAFLPVGSMTFPDVLIAHCL